MGEDWESPVYYLVLDTVQREKLEALNRLLPDGDPNTIDIAFHRACYILFAHHRHQYPTSRNLDKFFSPVNVFMVYTSVEDSEEEGGGFKKAGLMTQSFAAIVYAIRATMLMEVEEISQRQNTSVFE